MQLLGVDIHYEINLEDDCSWIELLPSDHQELFKKELLETIRSVAQNISDHPDVKQLLHEWKATAEIHSDPDLLKSLTEAITI